MRRGLLLFFVAVVVGAGCQHMPGEPPVTPQPPPVSHVPQPPFEAPEAPDPDTAPLRGRLICIDPGHGGRWPGAVSPGNKLRESDVNLRVALALRDILEAAGAQVLLTRDRDVELHPDNLTRDLDARPLMANRAGAEVFVSIHHNADISPNSQRNDLEVYYKMSEEGPSLDLAQSMTRALARHLRRDAEAKRLYPGNYRVLRLAEVPAVLLESSYMTNARNAEFLASAAGVQAEARAIAAGLESYFALDPPRVASAELHPLDQGMAHQAALYFARGGPIEATTARVLLNGESVPGEPVARDNALFWTFRDTLPNGAHEAVFEARNLRGAAFRHVMTLDVQRPPAALTARQSPQPIDRGSDIEVLVEARVLDAAGLPVADGTAVTIAELGAAAQTVDGAARFYIRESRLRPRLTLASGGVSARMDIIYGGSGVRTLRVMDAASNRGVGGVLVEADGRAAGVTNPDGWIGIQARDGRVQLARTGYNPASGALAGPHTTFNIERADLGLVHGRTIVLDPAYGGRNPGFTGPSGVRSSDINFDVARRLAGMLERAGARVVLTRNDDSDLNDVYRVRVSDGEGADIHITISFGTDGGAARVVDQRGLQKAGADAFVGHFPGSNYGARLAQAIAEELGNIPVASSVAHIIQQTGAPAVWVQPAFPVDLEAEDRLTHPDTRRAIALAMYRAVVAYFESVSSR